MNPLGHRIKYLRQSNHLTQAEFSNKLGVSRSFISKLENGKVKPSTPLIRLICAMFSIEESWLTNDC